MKRPSTKLKLIDFMHTNIQCRLSRLASIFPLLAGLLLIAGFLLLAGCSSRTAKPFDLSKAKYVGQASCIGCHLEEAASHAGSHHQEAMQLATELTVLGDFDNAVVNHHGMENRMFRKDGKFWAYVEGPDGQMRDFEVKYVFGVDPLQQYMVEFPSSVAKLAEGELPRIQVLRLCWDTQKSEWFYLPPPDVEQKLAADDDLHWTGVAQRWNNMCAECHSTNYKKGFVPPDVKSPHPSITEHDIAGAYHSSFTDINVSCEACHGPGSVHIQLAQQWFPGWNRTRGYGLANLKASAENQIQACAPCHSRRNIVAGGFRAGDNYYDHYSNQLITENVYYPDGQILDEDYVHGSFIQSKMYHKGIRCTDCHDPHTARLKHSGNEVCTSCHQHPVAKYDSVSHHRHEPGSAGAQCVNCHMPSTTYMAVDSRRDHSLRIPRPDLSSKIGTPNACTGCHLKPENIDLAKRDKLVLYQDWMAMARSGDEQVRAELDRANQWCDAACDQWYGTERRRDEHFGQAIAAGQNRDATAKEQLTRLLGRRGAEAPYIARATALQVLSQVDSQAAAAEAHKSLDDEHPLVRSAATSALFGDTNPLEAVTALEKALSDPIRIVRTEAARNLLEFPPNMWSPAAASGFRAALTELVEGLKYNNDRSGAHMAMGLLAARQGRQQQAITHYETAIAIEPQSIGPRTNLAGLLESMLDTQMRDSNGELHPLRQRVIALRKAELPLLARDARLLPNAAELQYRYGLALYLDAQAEESLGRTAEAEKQKLAAAERLQAAAEMEPAQVDYAQAVAMLFESLGRRDEALRWSQQAVEASDNSPESLLLLERIRQGSQSKK